MAGQSNKIKHLNNAIGLNLANILHYALWLETDSAYY